MKLTMLDITDGGSIVIMVVLLLVAAGLIYLLYRSIKKEQKKYKEENIKLIDGMVAPKTINRAINDYMDTYKDATFSLIYLQIEDFKDIVLAIGDAQALILFEQVIKSIRKILPRWAPMAIYTEYDVLIFLKNDFEQDLVKDLAKRIMEFMSQPVNAFGAATVNLTSSMGICYYPAHGRNLDALFQSLKMAVHVSKRAGSNKYTVYSSESSEVLDESISYYNKIQEAIKKKEFTLYYQPMIDLSRNDIYGLESLIRWNSPTEGVIPPNKFLKVMEQTGDINFIAYWGLETLIIQHNEWKKTFPDRQLVLTLNLSPKQVANPNIISEYNRTLKKHNFSAKDICLEINEFAMFDQYSSIKQNLVSLQRLGFKMSIDASGLDYSLISKIDYLPIDIIKLNRIFFEDANFEMKKKFITLLTDIAKGDHIKIMAAGIEDVNYYNLLKDYGIEYAQGYYFEKSISVKEAEEYISNEKWKEKTI